MSLTANLAACPSWGSDAVGGFAKSRIRKLSFVKFEFLSYCQMISLLNLLLTRVLCMPFRQSIQVLIWSWKARWHLHLHLHSDCDAAEMGTLHAPPCPLTCLAGGVRGIIRVGGLLSPVTAFAQTITSLKVVSCAEFRGWDTPNFEIFKFSKQKIKFWRPKYILC